MKHLFLTIAPVVAVYLLRTYCQVSIMPLRCPSITSIIRSIWRLGHLFVIALAAITVAFIPFILFTTSPPSRAFPCLPVPTPTLSGVVHDNYTVCWGPMQQIISRLFPFGRGLVHAYWAPNIWALYLSIDKCLAYLSRITTWDIPSAYNRSPLDDHDGTRSSSSGLVGDYSLFHLPPVTPAVVILLLLVALLPAIISLCMKKRLAQEKGSVSLIRAIQYSAFTAFMLGYHVHEKAILVVILPATLLLSTLPIKNTGHTVIPSCSSQLQNFLYLQVAAGGVVALLPLFPNLQEVVVKGLICFSYLAFAHITLAPTCGAFYARYEWQ